MICSKCQAPNPPVHLTIKVGNAYLELNFCVSCLPNPQIDVSKISVNMICCPRCGTKAKDINARGFGCADDYDIFAGMIVNWIQGYHGASQHVGKTPSKISLFSA